MKDTIMYLVGKMAVKAYEKSVVYPSSNELKQYRLIKDMTGVAQSLVDDDDPRFNELGVRIAKANLIALTNMYRAK